MGNGERYEFPTVAHFHVVPAVGIRLAADHSSMAKMCTAAGIDRETERPAQSLFPVSLPDSYVVRQLELEDGDAGVPSKARSRRITSNRRTGLVPQT